MRRLKADKKKELLGRLKLLSQKKILAIDEQYEIDYSWKKLCWDFESRLSLDLRHISSYAFLDRLKRDTGDLEIDSTDSYVKHFDNGALENIYDDLMKALIGIIYLCNVCEREMNTRNKDKGNLEKHNSKYCNVKNFNFHPMAADLKQLMKVCLLNHHKCR